MAFYRVLVGAHEYRVEISDHELIVDGEKEQVSLTALNGGGLYLLRHGMQNREMHVHPRGRRSFEITADGRRVIAQVEKGNGSAHPGKETLRAGDLLAPMPGMVVKVAAAPGETVERGQVLVVLESMKMQMELRAPVSGRVCDLPVSSKALVEKGTLLARVDQLVQ